MTFEEAFAEIVPLQTIESFTPEQMEIFKRIALSFYKAGEIQGVTNVSFLVEEAAAMRAAMDKEKSQSH